MIMLKAKKRVKMKELKILFKNKRLTKIIRSEDSVARKKERLSCLFKNKGSQIIKNMMLPQAD